MGRAGLIPDASLDGQALAEPLDRNAAVGRGLLSSGSAGQVVVEDPLLVEYSGQKMFILQLAGQRLRFLAAGQGGGIVFPDTVEFQSFLEAPRPSSVRFRGL